MKAQFQEVNKLKWEQIGKERWGLFSNTGEKLAEIWFNKPFLESEEEYAIQYSMKGDTRTKDGKLKEFNEIIFGHKKVRIEYLPGLKKGLIEILSAKGFT